MNAQELFDEIAQHESSRKTLYKTWDFIVIPNKKFNTYLDHFSKPVIIRSKKNYRSKHYWLHIHAVQKEVYTEIHLDRGNLYKNVLLGIPHLFIDVMRYFLWHGVKREKPYSF